MRTKNPPIKKPSSHPSPPPAAARSRASKRPFEANGARDDWRKNQEMGHLLFGAMFDEEWARLPKPSEPDLITPRPWQLITDRLITDNWTWYMNRNGKIARLPGNIREELNHRLENNEQSDTPLPWLNDLLPVKLLLALHFEGSPISKQNLSEWRAGGFLEWQTHQDMRAQANDLSADNAGQLEDTTDGPMLAEHLGTVCLPPRYAAFLLLLERRGGRRNRAQGARLSKHLPHHRRAAAGRPPEPALETPAGFGQGGPQPNAPGIKDDQEIIRSVRTLDRKP